MILILLLIEYGLSFMLKLITDEQRVKANALARKENQHIIRSFIRHPASSDRGDLHFAQEITEILGD